MGKVVVCGGGGGRGSGGGNGVLILRHNYPGACHGSKNNLFSEKI